MKDTYLLVFALLRIGLRTGREDDYDFVLGNASSRTDWNEIVRFSIRQGVAALVYDGLQEMAGQDRLPEACRPPKPLMMQLFTHTLQVEKHCRGQRKSIAGMAAFYRKHHIRMMILKGYSAGLNYPVPQHRPCGDIDIYLYGKQHEADRLMEQELNIKVDAGHHHHTVFTFGGVMVENHYDFFNIYAHRSNRELEQILVQLVEKQPGVSVDVDGETVYTPSADVFALFHIRHAAQHFAAEHIALRHLADWALFVRNHTGEISWPWLEKIVCEQNMHRFFYAINVISAEVFGIDASCFPEGQRDVKLEERIFNEILNPEFSEYVHDGLPFFKRMSGKLRRWMANRWKSKLVFKESLLNTFFVLYFSRLISPKRALKKRVRKEESRK